MAFYLLIGVLIAGFAVIILSTDILPFVDLPNHLAEATIYKYLGEESLPFSAYFQLTPWYFPNTFHMYFTGLFPDIEVGDRIYFLLYLVLLPVSVIMIIRKLNGNLWVGLLSFLLLFNYNVTFGFVGYYMAIPFILFFFALYLGTLRRRDVSRYVLMSALLVLIYFMHAQAVLFALLVYGLCSLFQYRKKISRLPGMFFTMLPVLLLMTFWWINRGSGNEQGTGGFLFEYYSKLYLPDFAERLGLPVMDHYHLYDGAGGYVFGMVISLIICFPLLYYRKRLISIVKNSPTDQRIYVIIFILAALGSFLLLPSRLPGQTPLFHRFTVFVFLGVIMLTSTLITSSAFMRVTVIACVAVYGLLWGEYFMEFNEANKGFRKNITTELGNKQMLAGLIYENEFRGRPVYIHFPNYHIVWNKGISASKIIDYRFGIVRKKPKGLHVPFYYDWIGYEYEYIPEYKLVDNLLVKGNAPVETDHNLKGFTLTKSFDNWQVYKKSPITRTLTDVVPQEEVQRLNVNKEEE